MSDNELIAYTIVTEKQKKERRKKKKNKEEDDRNLGELTELAHELHRKKDKK